MRNPDLPRFSRDVECAFVDLAGMYVATRVNASKDDGVDRSAEPDPNDITLSTTCETCHLGVCLAKGMITVEKPADGNERECVISPHVRDFYNHERFGSFIQVTIEQQHITNRLNPAE